MKILQKYYTKEAGWKIIRDDGIPYDAYNLVLFFAGKPTIQEHPWYKILKEEFGNAIILLSSASGEILDTRVSDDSVSLTAVQFDKTTLRAATANVLNIGEGYMAGKQLAQAFQPENLVCVLVISDGLMVNGSELVDGLQKHLPKDTIITGGLAADKNQFESTLVGINEEPVTGKIVAIGFYGKNLHVGFGCVGGWDPFGTERLITKSKDNILYELDGKPALDIYKLYLGDFAVDLPGSGLFFPLSIRQDNESEPVVRTLISVDENERSIRFAGNMPEGKYARLMKANFERLIEGASNAAKLCLLNSGVKKTELAILISCVGRKSLLLHRTEEEVEAVRDILGGETAISGFYSFGEIAPGQGELRCDLHNQTMTITSFTEI